MSLPVVHLQIIDELGMGIGILNLPMSFKESFNAIRIALGFHSGANIVIEAGQAQLSFILDDYVVKNHTTCHDVDKGFLVFTGSARDALILPSLNGPVRSVHANLLCLSFLCLQRDGSSVGHRTLQSALRASAVGRLAVATVASRRSDAATVCCIRAGDRVNVPVWTVAKIASLKKKGLCYIAAPHICFPVRRLLTSHKSAS
jgi:hypothetical protein